MKDMYMILDLQYGSTGKGLLAGYLARRRSPDVVVTSWGPNAGHTYIDANGRKFQHTMLANGIVSPSLEYILIGPGSVLNLDALYDEVRDCRDILFGKMIVIHPVAAIRLPRHIEQESNGMVKIGSTMKGTGAAMIERILRNPDDNNTIGNYSELNSLAKRFRDIGVNLVVDDDLYQLALDKANLVQIEGAQGFSLSMYHGHYPYTTSRDVTPMQVLADCAIPFAMRPEIIGTCRTFPIRVANRYDDQGNMIGTSGPHYFDQREMDWSELGIEPELTTVTKLPRRIFTWSNKQMDDAVHMCRPDWLFMNFLNYIHPEDRNSFLKEIEGHHVPIRLVGLGPTYNDVRQRGEIS